jgi:hypothetical protein
MRAALVLVVVVAMGCGPCGHGAGRRDARDGGGSTRSPGDPPSIGIESVTGVIEGTVRLAEGAEVPVAPEETGNAPWPASCTPPQLADRRPVGMDATRGLAGVLVSVSEFEGAPPRATAKLHRVSITDCRLAPRFLVATRGDRLEIRNVTNHPFIATFSGAGPGVQQALLHQQVREHTLDTGGVHEIACTFGSQCGRTQIAVLYHPLHGLTETGGRFRIERVPAGPMELHAWHPLLRDAMQRITVTAGQTTRVDLTIEPAPAPPPPPPPGPPDPNAPF